MGKSSLHGCTAAAVDNKYSSLNSTGKDDDDEDDDDDDNNNNNNNNNKLQIIY
jgi:hypothetical protein